MKKVLLILLLIFLVGCSNDDCEGDYNEIVADYQRKIQYVIDSPLNGEINYRQIDLLKSERDRKLLNACK